jgi:sialate O-acetylesterase
MLIGSVLLLANLQTLPFLSPVFGDHMVLQRDKPNTFWGWTTPGATVQIRINDKTTRTAADKTGKWTAKLTPPAAGGPYQVEFNGPEKVVLKDVLVGDVWICSGQSNMEMGIQMVNNAQAEVAQSNHPDIRLYNVPHATPYTPIPVNGVSWAVCNPQSIAAGGWGGFSAVGYFFGRELNQKLKVPIGLVQTAWGGTIAEAWTSREGLIPLKDFDARLAMVQAAAAATGVPYAKQVEDWFAKADTSTDWLVNGFDDSKWKPIPDKLDFASLGLGEYDGLVYYRRTIQGGAGQVNGPIKLHLGQIDDADVAYLNGQKLGSMAAWNADRVYTIPEGLLKPGPNTLAIRVYDMTGPGGITTVPKDIHLEFADGQTTALDGQWRFKVGTELAKLPAFPQDTANNPNVVTVLSNGMIEPLTPLAIKGAIWYQGESNADRAYQYRRLLPAMIGDWRKRFGQGDFPFLVVQLANFTNQPAQPIDDAWAELREAQAMAVKNVHNAGLAVSIDIGDAADIHPKDKQTVGHRLALAAFKVAYAHVVAFSGPEYRSMKREGSMIRVTFSQTDRGLKAKDGRLIGFAIAGADKKFHWAQAEIAGPNTVVVSAPEVKDPVAVRYAWSANPNGATLYNSADLPAIPFRTDDWPGLTANNK